jgi:hypothetical protein
MEVKDRIVKAEINIIFNEFKDCIEIGVYYLVDGSIKTFATLCDEGYPWRDYTGVGVALTERESVRLALEDLYCQIYVI